MTTVVELKKCSWCGDEAPKSSFPRNGRFIRNQCQRCLSKDSVKRAKKNPSGRKAVTKAFYKRHRDRLLLERIASKYKVDAEEIQRLRAEQNGLCAICGNPETEVAKRWGCVKQLSVDHDHETGKIRGLLCRRCNSALAWIEHDDVETAMTKIGRAINYLALCDKTGQPRRLTT